MVPKIQRIYEADKQKKVEEKEKVSGYLQTGFGQRTSKKERQTSTCG
jgi:hypothetical protein